MVLPPLPLGPDAVRAISEALVAADLPGSGLAFSRARDIRLASWAKDPWIAAGKLPAWHDRGTAALPELLSEWFRTDPATPVPRPPLTLTGIPEKIKEPVGKILLAMLDVNAAVKGATARLSTDERTLLVRSLPALAAPVRLGESATPPGPTLELLSRTNVPAILAAGATLSRTIDDALPLLRAAANDPAIAEGLFRTKIADVTIEIGGRTDDRHDSEDATLVLDFGGDDLYAGRIAAAPGRASVLIDLAGDDRYRGGEASVATGLLGVGLLIDGGGDDDYRSGAIGLGAGVAGMGILRDGGGEDRYAAPSSAGGVGVRGLGWLLDGGGDDLYRVADSGLAAASRDGAGLLTDRTGRDRYLSEVRAQGYAADGAIASLDDGGGDDLYSLTRAGQSAADREAASFLLDRQGDDVYLARLGNAQSAAFADSTSVLLDAYGDDLYAGSRAHPGLAVGGSVAVLVDGGGDDRYAGEPARGLAAGETGAFAFVVDAAGRDLYDGDLEDGQAARLDESAAYDAPLPAIAGPVGPANVPADAPPGDLLAYAAAAPGDGVRGLARERLAALGREPFLKLLDARLTDADDDELRVLASVARSVSAMADVAERAKSPDDRIAAPAWRLLALAAAPEGRAALPQALERPERRRSALRLAGALGARETLSLVLPMILDADPLVAREAAVAAAAMATATESPSLQGSLTADDAFVRIAVERYFARFPELGEPLALGLTGSDQASARRRGVSLLGRLGTTAAIARAGVLLADADPGVRIGALRALDGRCPATIEPKALALREDPDPAVRAAARRFRP